MGVSLLLTRRVICVDVQADREVPVGSHLSLSRTELYCVTTSKVASQLTTPPYRHHFSSIVSPVTRFPE